MHAMDCRALVREPAVLPRVRGADMWSLIIDGAGAHKHAVSLVRRLSDHQAQLGRVIGRDADAAVLEARGTTMAARAPGCTLYSYSPEHPVRQAGMWETE